MPSWLQGWPFAGLYLFFLAGALARSQAMYWLGRGVAAGVLRSSWQARLANPRTDRARGLVERWGMPVVPLAFLTVGLQSAVFTVTGLLRVGWLRFSLWALPGALVWAGLWTTGGIAVLGTAAAVVTGSREGVLVVVAVLLVAAMVVTLLLRRRAVRDSSAED